MTFHSIAVGRRLWLRISLLLGTSLLWIAASKATPPPQPGGAVPQIGAVEVEGVRSIEMMEVEKLIEIGAGDPIQEIRVQRSVENLKEFYRTRGFLRAQVRARLLRRMESGGDSELRLLFQVEEGPELKISKVHLRLLGPGSLEDPTRDYEQMRLKFWDRQKKNLLERVGLRENDRFQEERISNGIRSGLDFLAGHDWIQSEIEVLPMTQRELRDLEEVEVEIRVRLGDRVRFGFRGQSLLVTSELLSLVDEVRVLGFSKDYPKQIADRIREEYLSRGYTFIQVEYFTFETPEERRVSYQIREGPRARLGTLFFEGSQVFPQEVLLREFRRLSSVQVSRGVYVEREVERTAELLVEWMKTQGFLGAKLLSLTKTKDPHQPVFDVTIYLFEGDQTITKSVELVDLNWVSREEALQTLGVKEGAPLNLFAFNEGLEALKSRFRALGFLDMRIANEMSDQVVVYESDNREARIRLELQIGGRARVSRVEFEGLGSTHREIVERELRLAEGDILTEKKIRESETRVRRLGIFGDVAVREITDTTKFENLTDGETWKRVKVTVQEGTPGLVGGGLGFRNDLGARAFGRVSYNNLWHRNHTLSLLVETNKRFDRDFCGQSDASSDPNRDPCFIEYQVSLGYTWPWFGPWGGVPDLSFRPRMTFGRVQWRIFDTTSAEFAMTWDKPLVGERTLMGYFTYSIEKIQQFNARDPLDNASLTIGSISPSLALDLRDSNLSPTKGWYLVATHEISNPSLLSQNEPFPVAYTRSTLRSDFFIPLPASIVGFFSFRTGYQVNQAIPPADRQNDLRYAIPLSRQFALGGNASLRGFREQSLNLERIAIRGSASYVNYRSQLEIPFVGQLKAGPFLDAANLQVDSYSLGNLRYGAGFGFRYRSPVGPINFDWGFNIRPEPGEDTNRFHFSIGIL